MIDIFNKKKYIKLLMFILVLSTCAFFGLTYAYFRVRIVGNTSNKSISVTSKKLEVVYEDNKEVIVASDILPGDKFYKEFKVKNTGDDTVSYSLKFDNINSTFTRSDWSYTLKDINGETIADGKILTNVQEGVQVIVNQVIIEPNTTQEYLLEVSYDYSLEDQSVDMEKSLDLRVNIGDPISSVSLVNVPIDSRPITTSNFEYLVNATNFNYVEVSNGLDNYDVNGYHNGSSETVQSNLNEYLKSTSLNSTVIINLSSYMFGGLISSRNPDLYYDKIYKNSLNTLENVIEAYPNNRFYINFTIPRAYIEDRVNAYENANTYTSDTLNYYVYSDNSSINFMYAIEQWSYIYFMKLMNSSNYDNIIKNSTVNNFYNNFYNKYKSDCDKYVNMYEQSILILKKLKSISDANDNVIINYSLDDPTLSEYVTQFESIISSFIVRDSEDNIVKYNGTNYVYDYANNLFGNDYVNLSSVDDYNYVVLARELNRVSNRKTIINENYSSSELKDYVGSYDSLTLSELFEQDQRFINADVSSDDVEYINAYYAINLSESLKSNYINSINSLGNNKMIISNSYNVGDIQILSDIVLEKFSVFNFASFGGWNTNANAIGTQIGRTVTYMSLFKDIDVCIDSNICSETSLTSELLDRVNNYDKTRLIGVLEDSVYNLLAYKNINALSSNIYYNYFLNEFFNTKFDMAGYKYNYSANNSSIVYSNPWSRDFEIKYEIVLKS